MNKTRTLIILMALLLVCSLLFASCTGNGGVPVTNANGETVTDANGDVITAIPSTDIVVITDEQGNTETSVVYKEVTVAVPVTDENGKAVTDADGNAVTKKIAITPTYSSKNTTAKPTVPAGTTAFHGVTNVPLTDGQGNTVSDTNGNIVTYTLNITEQPTLKPGELTVTSWKRCVGGTEADYITAVAKAGTGYVALCVSNSKDGDFTGFADTTGKPSTIAIKYDENGNEMWRTLIGGAGVTTLSSLSVASDGSIYAAGYGTVDGNGVTVKGSYDAVVYKLSADGSILWARNFGTTGVDNFNGIQATSNGGVVCVGSCGTNNGDAASFNRTSNKSTGVAVRYSSSGEREWLKVFGGEKDRFEDVCEDANGNLFVTGTFYSDYFFTCSGSSDGGVVKLNSSGEQVWVVPVAGAGTEYFPSITLSGTGTGCVIAGRSNSVDGFFTDTLASRGALDAFVVNINDLGDSGIIFWGSAFRGQNDDSFDDIICTGSNYVVTGFSGSTTRDLRAVGNRGGRDAVVACFSLGGELEWSRGFGGSFDDSAASLCAASGGYIVAGKTLSFDNDLVGASGHTADGLKTAGLLFKITE